MLNIVFLGLVSFFTDISTEMVYPLIPLYLTETLGATPALVGIIEGIAESLASLLKVFSGYISDKYQKKKALAFSGYATGLLYKVALLLSVSWVGILASRVIDRIGKGIRTAPRDVMVSESASANEMGRAFGTHKALDMAGSAIGILISYLLLTQTVHYKSIFALSAIPALLGLFMFFFIREKKVPRPPKVREAFWKNIGRLDQELKFYLFIAFLFTLGNSSNTFLLLRAKSVGFTDASVILLYLIFNLTASALAIPFGKHSDQVGRKRMLVIGYLTFSVVYAAFALASNSGVIIFAFIAYGVYTAMISGVERAYIAEISPASLKGTMLGLHATLVGFALLPASVIAGLLWYRLGAYAPFILGALLSLISALLLQIFMKNRTPNAPLK
ncbi:MAG: hypothetical protein PWQ12_1045 [Clostridiales bacterium]|nr:hypothetical protein [Clostridiales bacterium]